MPRQKRNSLRFGYKSKTEKQVNLPIVYTKNIETERMVKLPVSYYGNYEKTPGLVLHLNANDNVFSYPSNSNIWYDTSGSRNNGTLSGNYSLVDGKAIKFGAGGENVLSKCLTSLNSSDYNKPNSIFSFAICFNFSTATPPASTIKRLFGAEAFSNSTAWAVQYNTLGNLALFNQTIISSTSLVANKYYFIYASYKCGWASIYFNGSFFKTNFGFRMPDSFSTAGNIVVSGRSTSSALGNWTGNVAFVKMYNRELENIEIKDLYDSYKRQYSLPYF